MRVLLDTNIFISYLLTPHHGGSVQSIINAFKEGRFTLLLPVAVLEEIDNVVSHRPHLIKKISAEALTSFLEILESTAEIVPAIGETIPAIGRDVKDDYLLAYAVVGQADYLVTGDKDLLVLEEIAGVKIISTVVFAELLSAAASDDPID